MRLRYPLLPLLLALSAQAQPDLVLARDSAPNLLCSNDGAAGFACQDISSDTNANVDVLDRRAALLHDGALAADEHALRFEAGALPPGLYVVRATSSPATMARRITLLR